MEFRKFTLISSCVFFLAAAGMSLPALAQHADHDMSGMHASGSAMVAAEVRSVDQTSHRITLRHGATADMPAMTMVYPYVPSLKLPKGLKKGDKVSFSAAEIAGTLTVTAIRR